MESIGNEKPARTGIWDFLNSKHRSPVIMKTKIYRCPYDGCGKCYSAHVNMKRHVECIHLRLKDFRCHFCAKQLSSKQNFREHMYIHTGEKPFTCKACGEVFRQGSQLSQHKKIHVLLRPPQDPSTIIKLTQLLPFSGERFFNPEAPAALYPLPTVAQKSILPDLVTKSASERSVTEAPVVMF